LLHEQRGMKKFPRAFLKPLQVGPELEKARLCIARPCLMVQHHLSKMGRLEMEAGLLCRSSWVHSPPSMHWDEAGGNGGLQLPFPGCKGSLGLPVR